MRLLSREAVAATMRRRPLTSGFSGVSVVVGAGGAAGSAGANSGGNGGGSSFGALLSATGGGGGAASPAVTPPYSVGSEPAGIGTGGSINAQGSGGSPSVITILVTTTSPAWAVAPRSVAAPVSDASATRARVDKV